VTDVKIQKETVLLHYEPKYANKISIYEDFAYIIGFLYSFLENNEDIKHYAIQAERSGKPLIYIVSNREGAQAISEGNPIKWLRDTMEREIDIGL